MNIAFENSAATRGNIDPLMIEATTDVLGKFRVATWFYEMFESRVNDIMPFLLEGVAYKPLELIGEDIWCDITGLGQRQAVQCLRHMATLPGSLLREVEFSGSDLTKFELKSTKAGYGYTD
jgi:hypothetical protein